MTPRLFGLVRRLAASVEDAIEIVQETWLRILNSRSAYDPSRPLEPFAFRVAVNLWIDACRSRRPATGRATPVEEPVATTPGPEEMLFAAERSDQMRKCLEVLTAEEREIVTLRFWDDMTNQQISERLGTTATSVKGKSYRAVRKLADCMRLEDDLVGPAELRQSLAGTDGMSSAERGQP